MAAIRLLFLIESRFSSRNYKFLKQQIIVSPFCHNRISSKIRLSSLAGEVAPKNDTLKFDTVMKLRKDEARRTVVVEVKSNKIAKSLCAAESENIKTAYFYKLFNHNFLLMEFKSESLVKSFLNGAHYSESNENIPVFSHFVKLNDSNKNIQSNVDQTSQEIINYSKQMNDEIIKVLLESKDVSDQMNKFYEVTKLCDIQSRYRFLICKQLEDAFIGLFPFCAVKPFGSSVNGFGSINSDADMVLLLDDKLYMNDKRLTFQEKKGYVFERQQMQKTLEIFGDIIETFVPGCANVQKILRARVPIIKFNHNFTGLDCDLATSNESALTMSELLYLFGEYDNRLRPLVFTIFKWAKSVGVTNSAAGSWLTNFQLTLLVIFYLQQMKKPILPSLNELRIGESSNLNDFRNYPFVQDIKRFPKLKNDEDLLNLLKGFFSFYSTFDFKNVGMSINKGSCTSKPDYGCVYIENPLDTNLNVCRNVSHPERTKFVGFVKSALDILEHNESLSNAKRNWGILSLFHPSDAEKLKFKVHSLFENDEKTDGIAVGAEYTATNNELKNRSKPTVKQGNIASLNFSVNNLARKDNFSRQSYKKNNKMSTYSRNKRW